MTSFLFISSNYEDNNKTLLLTTYIILMVFFDLLKVALPKTTTCTGLRSVIKHFSNH